MLSDDLRAQIERIQAGGPNLVALLNQKQRSFQRAGIPGADKIVSDEATRILVADALAVATEIEQLRAQKDGAYAERDKLVAALAKLAPGLGGRCWLARHEGPWEDEWRTIVFVEFPETGQMSWHIHDNEVPMFTNLFPSNESAWDGHTTEVKYERLARLNPTMPF